MFGNLKMDMDMFFNKLKFKLDEYEKVRSQFNIYLSKDFNVFDYINPSKNRLSDIIADLLNTKGKHGQGDKFISLFFHIIKVDGIDSLKLQMNSMRIRLMHMRSFLYER